LVSEELNIGGNATVVKRRRVGRNRGLFARPCRRRTSRFLSS
jgi:hypothetical protein